MQRWKDNFEYPFALLRRRAMAASQYA